MPATMIGLDIKQTTGLPEKIKELEESGGGGGGSTMVAITTAEINSLFE